MKLSTELEVRVLAMADRIDGLPVSRTPTEPTRTAPLLPNAFRPPATWLIGIRADSHLNSGKLKRSAIGVGGRQRRQVVRFLCRYHAALTPFTDRILDGLPVVVRMARLGPGNVDGHAVSGDHLKHVIDAVADVLGTDDGNPLVTWRGAAEKANGYGVRIELEV